MCQTGVIVLCHGSRGDRGIVEVPEALRRVAGRIKPLLPPGVEVIGAALQFNHPSLEEAVESLAVRGVARIIVIPYFLFPGRHVTEDIPQLVKKLQGIYRGRQFMVANLPGLEEHFIGNVARLIEEAAPEFRAEAGFSPAPPGDIERRSLEMVEKLLPHPLNMTEEERLIVRRVVHASGDLEVAPLIRFSPSAVPRGLSAIHQGSPIFTDVRMVAAGINRRLAEACGCSISCALDEAKGGQQAWEPNITRAAAAVRHLGKRLNGAIVAIGNAPTALLALLDLIDANKIKPALVVGMPVGFIQAKESKDRLMNREVPHVTVVGTRGGSAMAAAAVNALLKIAVARKDRMVD